MLKPSFKSIEGQSLGGVLLGGLACLYAIFTGDDTIPVDQIIAQAENAKAIAAIYTQESANLGTSGLLGMGKAGVVLVFMYKMYAKFTDARTDLKASELEVTAQVEVAKARAAHLPTLEELEFSKEPKVSGVVREGDS